jgi:hypothetical protein
VWATKNPHFNKPIGVNMNEPAFPNEGFNGWGEPFKGMTLRDYFAASFVSSGHVFKSISDGNTPELVSAQAYLMADAMLKARGE